MKIDLNKLGKQLKLTKRKASNKKLTDKETFIDLITQLENNLLI